MKKLTPVMQQYLSVKQQHPNSVLLFRMGDFYEMFMEDAQEASQILNIALTSRDGDIPMCGVPYHAANSYINKLIKAGKTVTICEQVEDPKQAKGIVKREVVRTITPGTVLDPGLLDEKANNFLASLVVEKEVAGLAFIDLSTGEFLVTQLQGGGLLQQVKDELTRMSPAECLVAEGALSQESLTKFLSAELNWISIKSRQDWTFDVENARRLLLERYNLHSLDGLGLEQVPAALGAAGSSLGFLEETQKSALVHLRRPQVYWSSDHMFLDSATQRNLELVASVADGRKRGSLLGILDRTVTAMGGRRLKNWVLHPLLKLDEIARRQNAVEELFLWPSRTAEVHSALRKVLDLERIVGRIVCGGNARDLLALGRSLEQIPELREKLSWCQDTYLVELRDGLDGCTDVVELVRKAIVDDPPISITEGEIIREGYDERLDAMKRSVRDGRSWIASLQKQESVRTGIPTLKVGYNKIFGYYIEVSKSHLKMVPHDYIRKQTLVNGERYVTPELKEKESEIVGAQERMAKLEHEIFISIRQTVVDNAQRVQHDAERLSIVDALCSLALVAAQGNYAKPVLNEEYAMVIEEGRHPLAEEFMPRGKFVPNDTRLDESARLAVITGPNMAGKSTYIRQVALISLMAQIGSFVPAKSARLGIVDRIFTRVGANDNLLRGQSTFMVEMNETANILNNATERSLIILDEIGRGTSTYDGVSIAWSVAEHIHNQIGAKTLFATHYHELADLAKALPRVKNLNVAVRQWAGEIIFLYQIVEGAADDSYGIQVASLAGLPRDVLDRADEVLQSLEGDRPLVVLRSPRRPRSTEPANQLLLFDNRASQNIVAQLKELNVDTLTPFDALQLLHKWKRMM